MKSIPSKLLYYLIIKPISLLPFWMLYVYSDFFFLIIYRILGYRKKIVMENLTGSFPEKSPEELNRICTHFYSHFCDLIFESLKLFSASSKTLTKRMRLINPELPERFYKEGRSIVIVSGHYGNWEWAAIALPSHSSHKAIGIYLPLTNKYFNQKLVEKRGKSGLKLVPIRLVRKYLVANAKELWSYAFINDQSPSNPSRAYWIKFLNRDTATFTGAERYANEFNMPVLYAMIQKISRGHYTLEYKLVTEDPRSLPEQELTKRCSQINEEIIRAKPEYWLWTHRRWKHKKEDYVKVND